MMRLLLLFIFFQYIGYTNAQSRSKITYGLSLNPTITWAINKSNSTALCSGNTNQTISQYVDSVSAFESYKLSLGATLWVNYLLNQKWTMQLGLGYSEVGFKREQKNIEFNNVLFPGIGSGKLIEKSNSEKGITYNFKYQYLTVPIMFNYYAKRSGDFKWSYYYTAGLGLNVLLNHQIKAKLDNFYVDNKEVFQLDSTGYEARSFALNLFLGGRIEYKLDKQIGIFGQPMLTFFPLSVSKTEVHSFPLGLQLNLGITYSFDANKDGSN